MSRNELDCENNFRRMGRVYNANTPEDHPIIFKSDKDYQAAMSILAVSARSFPNVSIYAFQLMSNHVHFVISGLESTIQEFFDFFVRRLGKSFESADFSSFHLKLFHVSDLSYLRNAIAYVNRNGFVVNNDFTPLSYPWGSSRYFFQPLSRKYDEKCGQPIGVSALRALIHSRSCDCLKDLMVVDGYISPLEFCHVAEAENVFRDAKQYFYVISKNVENYSNIAKSIGESIYYTDTDLYNAASKMAKESFGSFDLRTLPVDAKLEIAKSLHYDYNAGDKQLCRMLGIDLMILKAMF